MGMGWGIPYPSLSSPCNTPGSVGTRTIIAHPAPNVNRQNAQKIKFVQNAQNDTHGTVDTFCLCKLHNTPATNSEK